MLRYHGMLCVPDVDDLRRQILEETHGSQYSIHPGATKIYRDLQEIYLVERFEEGYSGVCG